MALQDIINAIIGDTDHHIAEAKSAHEQRLSHMRDQLQQERRSREQAMAKNVQEKKVQLRQKTERLAAGQRRNAIATTRLRLLDKTYAGVIERLEQLPDDQIKPLLQACLATLPAGVVHPAKKHAALIKSMAPKNCTMGKPIDARGGFHFVSATHEKDCTLEAIVQSVLRPETELNISHQYFSA
ncbi:hypothetical protein FJZ27_03420 [Candidatus Peribacteria bacterium]|nr:hypothetical protein [Candidatus Peribacteria bacterium]